MILRGEKITSDFQNNYLSYRIDMNYPKSLSDIATRTSKA